MWTTVSLQTIFNWIFFLCYNWSMISCNIYMKRWNDQIWKHRRKSYYFLAFVKAAAYWKRFAQLYFDWIQKDDYFKNYFSRNRFRRVLCMHHIPHNRIFSLTFWKFALFALHLKLFKCLFISFSSKKYESSFLKHLGHLFIILHIQWLP